MNSIIILHKNNSEPVVWFTFFEIMNTTCGTQKQRELFVLAASHRSQIKIPEKDRAKKIQKKRLTCEVSEEVFVTVFVHSWKGRCREVHCFHPPTRSPLALELQSYLQRAL